MIRLHLDGLLVGLACVIEIVQPVECDGEIHVARGEVWLEVDRGGEVVEGGSVLASVEMDEAQIVRDDPLEGVEVERALEARDARDVALLAW